MKVTLEKEYRKLYTLDDLERAKHVIKYEKEEDEDTAKCWAEYAIREALKNSSDYMAYILTAEAHTAKNCRAFDAYGIGSQDMDVWIEATAKTVDGFIMIGAYLSDIWQSGAVGYKEHMYIRYFKEANL